MAGGGYTGAIGGYLQGIGGTIDAFGGGGDYNVLRRTKNPGIQTGIDNLVGGYGNVAGLNSRLLSQYIDEYLGGARDAKLRTGQEIGSMDQFYNGSMANQLAQLRAERASAMTNAAGVASAQALRGTSAALMPGSAGPSSYGSRLAMANLTPIQVQASLDANNQSRADLGYLTQNQIALSGQRQALANALAQYRLQPIGVQMGVLGSQAGYLGQLTNIDQANNYYGLQYSPNLASSIAASLEATGAGLSGGQGAAQAGAAGRPSANFSTGTGTYAYPAGYPGGWGGGSPMTGTNGFGGVPYQAMQTWGTNPMFNGYQPQMSQPVAPMGSSSPMAWGQWGQQTSNYYNNPYSPGYVQPGTFE